MKQPPSPTAADTRLTPVTTVHHAAPGRVRIRVQGLYRSDRMKRDIERLREHSPLLQSVAANHLTGTVLIHFDRRLSLPELLDWLEDRLRHLAGGAVPARHPLAESATPVELPSPAAGSAAWHSLSSGETLDRLGSSQTDGLTDAAALTRLQIQGPNVLSVQKPRSLFSLISAQILNPPVALLAVSAGVSVATGGVVDAVVILSVVVINTVIGYVTESTTERIISSLGQMTPTQTLTLRNGQRVAVPIETVVPGDILVLEPGTYIPADGRLLASNRLSVDESALTGESLPVSKRDGTTLAATTPLADRNNMVHRGTVVTGGSGLAVAVATGGQTEIGIIQALVGELSPPETPLQRQLDGIGTQLALLSGGICVGLFGLGLLRGYAVLPMLKSAISLAVAAIPEGLPTVATTTLALGIGQMHRRKVLVRQLPAVEALGSIQTLCLDKTGTLTENRMTSVWVELADHSIRRQGAEFWPDEPGLLARADLRTLLESVCLCSEVSLSPNNPTQSLAGSPTETALVEIALQAGIDMAALRTAHPLEKIWHRAEDRPYMMTRHRATADATPRIAVKGSPVEILALCTHRLDGDGNRIVLDERQQQAILACNERMAGQALRVLAVACADTDTPAAPTGSLTWLGLVGMEDALRPGMAELMAQFHAAGIDTVMITGDQSATAYSVSRRLALNHTRPLEIIDSTHLDKLEPDVLRGIVSDTSVFARVSPAHKLRIVQALQQSGRVVAMTGDGINDGPALRAADVGVALGERGTEVARSVADVVLEDDNLHTLIAAVEQGRTIYANIRKSLHFLLSSNLSEIEIMLVGTLAGTGEVLSPVQLLWINLLTDILPGLALALEPPEQDVLKQPPRDPAEAIIRPQDAWTMLRESLLLTGGALAAYGITLHQGGTQAKAGGNAFMTLTLGQLLHALSCRSETTGLFNPQGRPANPALNYALAASALLQLLAALLPALRTVLGLSPMTARDWLAVSLGAGTPFLCNEGLKLLHPSTQPQREPA